MLTGLIRADRESESDPYVTISTADASGMTTILRTPVIRNEQTYAHWAGPFEAHVVDIGSLTLHVIDSDRGTDDPMGEVITPLGAVNVTFLQPTHAIVCSLALGGLHPGPLSTAYTTGDSRCTACAMRSIAA